jgi:hypothetical protein
MKSIQIYAIDHGGYPDTLQDLVTGTNNALAKDPINNATYYYFYQKFNANDYGCTSDFYVLAVSKFENSPKLPSWKCPSRDFGQEFDWALGGYER